VSKKGGGVTGQNMQILLHYAIHVAAYRSGQTGYQLTTPRLLSLATIIAHYFRHHTDKIPPMLRVPRQRAFPGTWHETCCSYSTGSTIISLWRRMKTSHRTMTSLLLAVIYLLITFSPLAPLAMQSSLVVHAVTGKCTGRCEIDGCSPERSATRTCCCWQKKHAGSLGKTGSDCETHLMPPAAGQKRGNCCADRVYDTHENAADGSTPPEQTGTTPTISTAPCGTGTLFTLLHGDVHPHLPFIAVSDISTPGQGTLYRTTPERLTSRYSDPPDPPPIIS
jgi:hypothetical protein